MWALEHRETGAFVGLAGFSEPANCSCPCSVTMDPNFILKPGDSRNATLMIKNHSGNNCTYTYTLRKSNGQLNVNFVNATGSVTVPANSQTGIVPQVAFPTGRPAPDEADLVAELTHTDGSGSHLACSANSFVCVSPSDEHTLFREWKPAPNEDVARFDGIVEPSGTTVSTDGPFTRRMPVRRWMTAITRGVRYLVS